MNAQSLSGRWLARYPEYMAPESDPHPKRNGNLRIPLPFDEALRVAMETKSPPKLKKKRPAKKS